MIAREALREAILRAAAGDFTALNGLINPLSIVHLNEWQAVLDRLRAEGMVEGDPTHPSPHHNPRLRPLAEKLAAAMVAGSKKRSAA